MKSALDGIRVVEFSSFTAGPLCGALLAQLGAQVVKVEPPDGDQLRRLSTQIDGVSYLFHINNGGKRSVVADLKQAEGRARALDLAADADVVLENFAPGTLGRRGLDYASVRARNPGVVYCSVNGFGASGPLKDERAYDVVIQGLSGIVSLSGHDREHPVKVGPSIVDMMGAVMGASAIIAALRYREQSGEGQSIELAMYDVAAWLTAGAWPQLIAGRVPRAAGNRGTNGDWQDLFATVDGHVVIAAPRRSQRDALRTLCVAGARATEDEEELRSRVADWCCRQSTSEVVARCQEQGVVAAPVLGLEDVATHQQFRERGILVEMQSASGRSVPIFGSPLRMSRTPGVAQGFAEAVGASTESVLADVRARQARRRDTHTIA